MLNIFQQGQLGRRRVGSAAGATDPNFANVVALLHMDGADASTSFPDNSIVASTWTANGNAQVDTAQSKFGGASLLVDGSGDYLSTGAPTTPPQRPFDFTGQFCIEGHFRVNAFTNLYGSLFASGSGIYSVLASAIMIFGSGVGGGNAQKIHATLRGGESAFFGTSALSAGIWYHFALTRDGSNGIRLFLNGVQQGSTVTNSNPIDFHGTGARIGSNGWDGGNSFFNGWIDDLRITKGVARYTADFTAPTAAFPNS